MIPVRLELKNFLPYRSPDPLRFEGVHLACLTGGNGAGKSSILDAVTWALWGRSRAKRDDDLLHLGQNDMYIQLDFEQEGIVYRVLRRRARSKRSAATLDMFVLKDDGQPTVITEPSMRATQAKINNILRLDYETFVHSAFLQQGKADAFTTKAPGERKRILSDILGLEQWARYEDATKARLKAITNELEVIDIRVREINTELAKEPRLKADLSEAEKAHGEAQEMLKIAEAQLAEVAHAPAELKRAQEQQATQERRQRERESDLETVETDIERQQERIAGYEEIIAAQEEIESGYETLQTAREADTVLADKLRLLSDFDAQCHELERQIDAACAELKSEKSSYEARIDELERVQGQDFGEKFEVVQTEVAELETVEKQREGLQDEINALNEERAALQATQTAIANEGLSINDRLERLESTEDANCPLCGQELDEAHRAELIEQLTVERDEKRETYRINQERLTEIDTEVEERQTNTGEMNLTLKKLSPLRERAGSLQAQMEAAAEAETRLNKERAGLAEVEAALEEEDFAQDARAQLMVLETERQKVGYDSESHDAARQQLETHRKYEVEQTRLQVALDGLPNAKAALEAAHERQQRIETALEEDRAANEKLAGEIEQLEVLVREQQARQQEVNRQRTAERVAYQRVVNVQQELKALEQQRNRKAELKERRTVTRHQEGIYRQLREAFGKNGVPAMIIESAIPELEITANELLQRMTEGRMNLRFSMQREKASGGTIETLDIEIADELGTRGYEMYSGGEAFRINFAIRVALSKMLARRAGAHLRTLFIDEGFGTQDSDGRDRLVEAINAIQDDFDLVLVITHIDELRESFPVHIVVEKTGSGSMVSVR